MDQDGDRLAEADLLPELIFSLANAGVPLPQAEDAVLTAYALGANTGLGDGLRRGFGLGALCTLITLGALFAVRACLG